MKLTRADYSRQFWFILHGNPKRMIDAILIKKLLLQM